MTIYICPVCGSDLIEMVYPTYPPKHGVECFNCGYKEVTYTDMIRKVPFKSEKRSVPKELSEWFCIPCDLCHKYFNKDCPEEVETCNSEDHWRLLIERIVENEQS